MSANNKKRRAIEGAVDDDDDDDDDSQQQQPRRRRWDRDTIADYSQGLFGALSDSESNIQDKVFEFCKPNDLTELSMTCRRLNQLIHSFRGPLPHVLREERLPTRVGFESNDPVCAHQVHPFRFLVNTQHHGTVQVGIKLSNLFDTYCPGAEEDGAYSYDYEDEDPTKVGVSVFRCIRSDDGALHPVKLFSRDHIYQSLDYSCSHHYGRRKWFPSTCPWCRGFYVEDYSEDTKAPTGISLMRNEPDRSASEIPPRAKRNLQDSMLYITECAKRIPTFIGKLLDYPSMEYIMGTLPKELRQYFPSCLDDCDWSNVQDREKPRREWLAPSEWPSPGGPIPYEVISEYISGYRSAEDDNHETWEQYEIHELPWMIGIGPNNLLGQLPKKIVGDSIAPFLFKNELASLGMTCKALHNNVAKLIVNDRPSSNASVAEQALPPHDRCVIC